MNNSDLADHIATDHSLSKADARMLVDGIFSAIIDTASKGEEVSISGFGKFKVKETAEREGRNPATGDTITIACEKVGLCACQGGERQAQRLKGSVTKRSMGGGSLAAPV